MKKIEFDQEQPSMAAFEKVKYSKTFIRDTSPRLSCVYFRLEMLTFSYSVQRVGYSVQDTDYSVQRIAYKIKSRPYANSVAAFSTVRHFDKVYPERSRTDSVQALLTTS